MESMVPHPTGAHKAQLRQEFRARLASLSATQRAHESTLLASSIELWAREQGFTTLLATLPLSDEPDLTPVYRRWLSTGGHLALARAGTEGAMEFIFVESLDGPWERGPGGLRQPAAGKSWSQGPATLCLVPGLAFAWLEGALRLGRGGGYFDRWLAVHRSSVQTLGVGLSVSEAVSLPQEAWDQRLDGLALAGRPIQLRADPRR